MSESEELSRAARRVAHVIQSLRQGKGLWHAQAQVHGAISALEAALSKIERAEMSARHAAEAVEIDRWLNEVTPIL